MAKTLAELIVYQKALDASREVSQMLRRELFKRDRRLCDPLGSSSERVASAIAEGFEQSTDRHFAEYLYRARGSSSEVRTQLIVARDRRYLDESERVSLSNRYDEIVKMLTGLIAYLKKEDRKNRR